MTTREYTGGEAWVRRRMQTRMTLIGAAQAVVAEKGFQHATLAEIAMRAGLAEGAVVATFETKEDLFLAVIRAKGLRMRPVFPKNPTCLQVMTSLGEACADVLCESRRHSTLIADFHLYVMKHPEMARRVAQDYSDRFAKLARELVQKIPADELPLHPAVLVVVIQALALGLVMQQFLTPERVTEEVVIAAFEALAAAD